MLRVSVSIGETGIRVHLDGSLSGKWVDEVHREVSRVLSQSKHILLDCTGLSYADAAGVALLRSFPRQSVTTVNCSGFLRQQLSITGDTVPGHQTEVEDRR